MLDQTGNQPPKALEFADDPGASRSIWVAILLVLGITGWFASSFVLPPDEAEAVADSRTPEPITVAIKATQSARVPEVFVAE
ncbi:MAG: hypothetical protein QNJ16_14980, partial [Rhodobacter sp.]|nr:hypothetical protein [Rhodobacter sp.]